MSAQALLILLSALMTGHLVQLRYPEPFIAPSGGTLYLYILGLFTFSVFVWLERERPQNTRWRFWLVLVYSLLTITLVFRGQAHLRNTTNELVAVNDGIVQTEAAAKFLLDGINPYAADYIQTKFGRFFSEKKPSADVAASTHYAYPPAIILLMVPVVWGQETFDMLGGAHALPIIIFIAGCLLLLWAAKSDHDRVTIALLTLGNPLIWLYALAGFNDYVFVSCLFLAGVFFLRRNWVFAGIFFALALGAKQTAWLTIPFFGLFLMARFWAGLVRWSEIRKILLALGVTTAIIYGPFIVWNPAALYDDLIRYVSGGIHWSYPISGTTVIQYLVKYRFIDSPWSMFTTWPIQLAVFLPVVFLSRRWISRSPQVSTWLFCAALGILLFTLFGRFGAKNYYAAVALMFLGSYIFSLRESATKST